MNLATGALGGGGKFSPIISKSFYSKCTCTKCGIEFNTILPNSNDVWLDGILCDDCFDKWLMTQNKDYLKRSFLIKKLVRHQTGIITRFYFFKNIIKIYLSLLTKTTLINRINL